APQNFNRISGPDSGSCVACHNKPFAGGSGDNVANVFVLAQDFPHLNFDGGEGDRFEDHSLRDVGNERNTVGMFGSGWVELVAREMSTELRAIRQAASDEAIAGRKSVTKPLVTKGVDFGTITARPDGSFYNAGIRGVDSDLVVKPFHQKGVVASLREFTNNALNHHHGMQTTER
ncbi:MAG: thiol oxidoreductase, partial [Planctomycetes bacterium]|nr:thiol oxidoreductase [Planctomycetota bacterium]